MVLRETNIQSFAEHAAGVLSDRLGQQITVGSNTKLNDNKKTSLMLNDGNLCPVIYLDDLYSSEMSDEQIIDHLEEMFKTAPDPKDIIGEAIDVFTTDNIKNYESAKQYIQFRICNTEKNKDYLKDAAIKIQVEDLTVYAVLAFNTETSTSSSIITKKIVQMWGVNNAKVICDVVKPEFVVHTIGEAFIKSMERNGTPISEEEAEDIKMMMDQAPMKVVTTPEYAFGATVLAFADELEKLRKELGDFVIIPSSIHEVIILPYSIYEQVGKEGLECLIAEVNATEVKPEEVLSGSLYTYTKENGLQIAA